MAKKLPKQVVEKDATPTNPNKPKALRPRKKPQNALEPAPSQEPRQPEASSSTTAPPTKAKKKPPKPKKGPKHKIETETCFMFPSLHENIVQAVSSSVPTLWFQTEDTNYDRINYYETSVIGDFRCRNFACNVPSWGSKKVAIVIRGYRGNGYNAVVYNQRCEACDELGTMTLKKKAYVERVAYRLKKWAGVDVEPPFYGKKRSAPHRHDLCEGCKLGVCPEGKR